MDIRKKTCLILRKDHEYLVGRVILTGKLNWSSSPYDALKTRNVAKARYWQQRFGGELMLFNPIVGQILEFG